MGILSGLPNIGKVLEKDLEAIGIFTPEQLAETGSKTAFLRLRQQDEGACLHKLYALQGAIEGRRYTQLAEETKRDLTQFFNDQRGGA